METAAAVATATATATTGLSATLSSVERVGRQRLRAINVFRTGGDNAPATATTRLDAKLLPAERESRLPKPGDYFSTKFSFTRQPSTSSLLHTNNNGTVSRTVTCRSRCQSPGAVSRENAPLCFHQTAAHHEASPLGVLVTSLLGKRDGRQ